MRKTKRKESLLELVDNANRLCVISSALEKGGAYDESWNSTIQRSDDSDPTNNQPNCYTLDLMSMWLQALQRNTPASSSMLTDQHVENMFADLCLQTMFATNYDIVDLREPLNQIMSDIFSALLTNLNKMKMEENTNTNTNVNINDNELPMRGQSVLGKRKRDEDEEESHGMESREETVESQVIISSLKQQIKATMQCFIILIECDVYPQHFGIVKILNAVFDLEPTHPLREGALDDIMHAFLECVNGGGHTAGLVNVVCHTEGCFSFGLCREDLFDDLLFRGIVPFAISLRDFAVPDALCCLKCCQKKPEKFRILDQFLREKYGVDPVHQTDFDESDGTMISLASPLVMFPYLERAKAKMHDILMKNLPIKIPGLPKVIMSYIYFGERSKYYDGNGNGLTHKTLEFINWLRFTKPGDGELNSNHFNERFNDQNFAKFVTQNEAILDSCCDRISNAPSMRYVHELMKMEPPEYAVYFKLIQLNLICHTVMDPMDTISEGIFDPEPMYNLIIDWLTHIEQVYPQQFDGEDLAIFLDSFSSFPGIEMKQKERALTLLNRVMQWLGGHGKCEFSAGNPRRKRCTRSK